VSLRCYDRRSSNSTVSAVFADTLASMTNSYRAFADLGLTTDTGT
jgi:hypothetical protein